MKKIFLLFILFFFSINFVYAEISVTPYGAAQVVSGSCFLLNAEDEKVLIDCGLFIGDDSELYLNSDMPQELIDAKYLVLTHAHLDHIGRVPLLIAKGFRGKIYSTSVTKELALLLFKDRNGFEIIERKWYWSKVQREKAEANRATAIAHWHEDCKESIKNVEEPPLPITLEELRKNTKIKFLACKNCCAKDSAEIEKLFVTLNYNEWEEISKNIKVKLIDAGHIPGSASVIFDINGKKILFSGDLGSGYSRFNGEFSVPEKADMIFVEATYADDKSKLSFLDYEVFQNDLSKALKKGKTVWIPALSFNRTQKVLYELRLMQKNGKLPKDFPIYSVSPSANNITEIYQKELKKNERGIWFTEEIYKEKTILPEKINLKKNVKFDNPLILISSSGDLDKGMSAHFVSKLLPRKDLMIMLVNYVKPKSTAGMLLSGKNKINGVKSSASVKKYDVFSDHAGFEMIRKWLSNQYKETSLYIVHSEKKIAEKMEMLLKKDGRTNISKASYKEKVVLEP
ncbi:MAG: MBL fold metallo-hydrolase [Endomicrobium sp.]|jgi:metallo-beta-lactamase family protein|nr:MBL fold metallo-hydrolase [Endomicrobium sp.]